MGGNEKKGGLYFGSLKLTGIGGGSGNDVTWGGALRGRGGRL